MTSARNITNPEVTDQPNPDGTSPTTAGFIGDLTLDEIARLQDFDDRIQARGHEYQRVRDYYDGKHRIRLTARAKKYLMASGYPYAHNFCERIVDTLVDRLEIVSVAAVVTLPTSDIPVEAGKPTAGAGGEETSAHEQAESEAGDALTEWLQQNLADIGFEELANIVHHGATVDGDAYPGIFYDTECQCPRINYALPEHCLAVYDPGSPLELEFVVKTWQEKHGTTTIERMNLHRADRIEKYANVSGAWGRWLDEDDANQWPTPWVDSKGQPRGVQYGHLRNRNRGKEYGTSEIRTAIPQQDALNKRMVDLDLVSDNQGYQQRWATGVEGSATLRNFAGSVWRTASKEAKFGYFPAGDLSQILAAIDTSVQHLGATTATPLHELTTTGTPPSGESKKTADAPLVAKARDRFLTFGNQWKRLLDMALDMAIDYKLVDVPGLENARITIDITWKDPEPRNEKEHWEVVQLKQTAGVSKRTTLTEDGYDGEREEELRALELGAQTAAITNQMRAGNEFGGTPA